MVSLKNLHSAQVTGFGGKADTLSQAHQFGIKTPEGIVCDSANYSIAEIKKSISEMKLPMIVRSSTSFEDGSKSSLAGVFKSVKVAKLEDLQPAIESVKDWSDSKEVVEMLEVFSLKDIKNKTNIIVQEYISGVASGVMFVYPEQEKILFQSSKLGSSVTDGTTTTTDRTVYFDNTETDDLVCSLISTAKQIAKSFTKPTDVEWVIKQDKTVYVLQIREITAEIDQQDYVQQEIARLDDKLEPHELYDDNILPDVDSPTPLTISILAKIYATDGALGRYLHDQYGARSKQQESFIAVLFARPYLDYKAVNNYLSKVSAKTYIRDKSIITFKTTVKSSFSIVAHPINAIFRIYRYIISVYRLRNYIKSAELPPPKKDLSMSEMIAYLVQKLSYDAFVTNGYIQFIEKQISKRAKNSSDYALITQDASMPPWKNTSELDIKNDCWHLSYNENEVSSPSMSHSAQGIKDIQRMYKLPHNKEDLYIHRDQVLNKFISTWDKTLLRNQLRLLDGLNQRRTNTHDKYVQTIRLIHYKVASLQTDSAEKILWYVTIDEVLQNTIPKKEILQRRKSTHHILQQQRVDTIQKTSSWRIRVANVNQDQGNVHSISSGYFQGLATENFQESHTQKTIALVKSLSNNVIINHEKLSGVITEKGSSLSHVAILAREIGLPIVRVNSIDKFKEKQVKLGHDSTGLRLEVIE